MADREGLLPFKLIEDDSGEVLTSFGGLPLIVETCQALGLGLRKGAALSTSNPRVNTDPRQARLAAGRLRAAR